MGASMGASPSPSATFFCEAFFSVAADDLCAPALSTVVLGFFGGAFETETLSSSSDFGGFKSLKKLVKINPLLHHDQDL